MLLVPPRRDRGGSATIWSLVDVSDWISKEYYRLIPEFLLAHFGFLLALVLLAGLLQQRRSPSSTIAWLLVILLAPYVGVPLFIVFGGRKVRRMAQRKEPIYHLPVGAYGNDHGGAAERLLASYGVPPPRRAIVSSWSRPEKWLMSASRS